MSWLFSQALVEAFSEANSWDGEPCAQLNVMPTAQPFWRNGKPIDASRLSRFGLTSQLLTADRGEELLTWFLEASRARTSASQDRETDLTEFVAGCGSKWRGSFAKYDHGASTWKTAQCSLLKDSTEFWGTWPRCGSMRNGECFQRPALELHTYGNESGLLPTPVTVDTGSYFNRSASDGAALRPTLGAMAKYDLWPTPTASLGTKGGRVTPRKSREGGTLIEAVSARSVWATPTVKGNYNRKGLSPQSGDGLATQVGGQLNPAWVEWLMGWPIGWTALQPLEMARFREWQQQHGACCEQG